MRREGVWKKKKSPFFILGSYKRKSGSIANSFDRPLKSEIERFCYRQRLPLESLLIWFSVSLESCFSSLPYRLFFQACQEDVCSQRCISMNEKAEAFPGSPFDQRGVSKHHGGTAVRAVSIGPKYIYRAFWRATLNALGKFT